MSEAETLPPPLIPHPPGTDAQWEREYRAFLRLLPSLLASHPGKYVAIHDGKVVATGESQVAVALGAYGKCGYVSLHVGLVAEASLTPVRIPSPRIWSGSGVK